MPRQQARTGHAGLMEDRRMFLKPLLPYVWSRHANTIENLTVNIKTSSAATRTHVNISAFVFSAASVRFETLSGNMTAGLPVRAFVHGLFSSG